MAIRRHCFPEVMLFFENTRLVSEVYVAEQRMYRITITPPLINKAHIIDKAHNIVFLVKGIPL